MSFLKTTIDLEKKNHNLHSHALSRIIQSTFEIIKLNLFHWPKFKNERKKKVVKKKVKKILKKLSRIKTKRCLGFV